MHDSEHRKNNIVPAVFFRKENVAKVILISFFSIIVYTSITSIFPLFY